MVSNPQIDYVKEELKRRAERIIEYQLVDDLTNIFFNLHNKNKYLNIKSEVLQQRVEELESKIKELEEEAISFGASYHRLDEECNRLYEENYRLKVGQND